MHYPQTFPRPSSKPFLPGLIALFLLSLAYQATAQKMTTAVYIGNQGNFSDVNGSVTVYNPATGAATVDAIPNLNTLIQSIAFYEGQGYVMANTSDRVDVFDQNTNNRTGQITDVPSPRYMAVVAPEKAYVSNLFSNTLTILDLGNNTATGSIDVGSNPEDIAVLGNRAYVANFGFGEDTTVTIIDTDQDQVVETIDVGCDGPRFIKVDAQDEVWVFCMGKTVYNQDFTEIIEQTNGEVVILDGSTSEEVARITLNVQLGGGALGQDVFYAADTQEAFALAADATILAFDTETNTTLPVVTIPGTEMVGGLAYDATVEQFYLGRLSSFTEAGFVSIHDRTGAEVDRFDAGIAPAAITLLQTGTNVAIEDPTEGTLPATAHLFQNFPNPFNPETTIPFSLPHPTHVSIKVYNMLGKEVATLIDQVRPAGYHTVTWHPTGLASGLYLYRLQAASSVQTNTLTLLK